MQADPLRKFYTSLREQRPDSQMARKWCVYLQIIGLWLRQGSELDWCRLMQMGLLSEEEAAAAYEELRNVK